MEEEFYISLPAKSKDQSVASLIRHALMSIDTKGQPEQNIGIEHFYLINAYTNDDRPSMYVKYAPLDKDEISRREENLGLREKRNDAADEWPIVFAEDHHSGLAINRLEQRMPVDAEQGNAIKLLSATADTLGRLGEVDVKDLMLHNYLDDDGLERPYVAVYYAS